MSLAWNGATWPALLGMAALLTASPAALAETTLLTCHLNSPQNAYREDGVPTIELNEAEGTIVAHFPQYTDKYNGDNFRRAHAVGPMPANFNPDTITFTDPNPVFVSSDDYSLDRRSGSLSIANSTYPYWIWSCEVGHRQF